MSKVSNQWIIPMWWHNNWRIICLRKDNSSMMDIRRSVSCAENFFHKRHFFRTQIKSFLVLWCDSNDTIISNLICEYDLWTFLLIFLSNSVTKMGGGGGGVNLAEFWLSELWMWFTHEFQMTVGETTQHSTMRNWRGKSTYAIGLLPYTQASC